MLVFHSIFMFSLYLQGLDYSPVMFLIAICIRIYDTYTLLLCLLGPLHAVLIQIRIALFAFGIAPP